MTDAEKHTIQCDVDRTALHAAVEDHEKRLRATETDLTEIKTKLAIWSGGGAIIGGLLAKLI